MSWVTCEPKSTMRILSCIPIRPDGRERGGNRPQRPFGTAMWRAWRARSRPLLWFVRLMPDRGHRLRPKLLVSCWHSTEGRGSPMGLVLLRGIERCTQVALAIASALLLTQSATAQERPLAPGEAYVTRFSGVAPAPGGAVINVGGTVGGIIDIRNPGRPPQGQHWVDAPKRNPVTAAQVGQ